MTNHYITFDIETTGLNPWFDSRITCICAKDSFGNEFKLAGDDEKDIIYKFFEWLKIQDNYFFVTANGKDFDIPFILTRCVINKILPESIEYFLKIKNCDLQQMTTRKISLNDLASLFLGTKKSGDGMYAIVLATEKRYTELVKYCMNDVLLTEQVYSKLNDLGLINVLK